MVTSLWAASLWAVTVAAEPTASPVKEATVSDKTMQVSLPKDWTQISNDMLGEDAGILLVTRRDQSGVRPSINAIFYGPGNTEFKDAQSYVERYHEPEPVQTGSHKFQIHRVDPH